MSTGGELATLFIVLPLSAVPLLFVSGKTRLGTAIPATIVTVLIGCIAALVLPGLATAPLITAGSGWYPDTGIRLRFDSLSAVAVLVTSTVTLGTIRHAGRTEYANQHHNTLLMLLLAGSSGLMITGDLFNAYVFLEITSIASYALVASRQGRGAFESTFKYVAMGTLAGLLFLWGTTGLYLTTGTLDLERIAASFAAEHSIISTLSATALIAGLLIKLGQVPFHAWKPDSLSGARYDVAAALSGISTTAFFVFLLRVLTQLPVVRGTLAPALVVLAGASIFFGHLMALRQPRYARLLSYSSVAHLGYGILAVSSGTQVAIAAGLFHVLVHAIMKSGLFFFGRSLEIEEFTSSRLSLASIQDHVRVPALCIYATLAMSMIGIPPALGFASKWHVVLETARAGQTFGATLVALGGAVALIYFLRVGTVMTRPGSNSQHTSKQQTIRISAFTVPAVFTVLILVLFVFSDRIMYLSIQIVAELTGVM